jgi:hypothetical protein
LSAVASTDRGHQLLALAALHFGRWNLRFIEPAAALDELNNLNTTRRTVVLFRVQDGCIDVVEKSNFFSFSDLEIQTDATVIRALYYYQLLLELIGNHFQHVSSLFAIELEDGHCPTSSVPIFSFQRPFLGFEEFGSNNVLLPDPDFIQHDFYERIEYDDGLPFALKRMSAIFVGSTTGRLIDHQVLDQLESPRLRSAVFFQHHPRVDFRLPNIVMCQTPAVAERLKQMGFGVGQCSWQEQLAHRFLISMDGNGATCSRVVLALKSNSVLLKYDSVNQLFYFPLLQPWCHYVPIGCDQEVERVLEKCDIDEELFSGIAQRSCRFYSEFLTRPRVEEYCYHLLKRYFSLTASARLGDELHRFRGINAASLDLKKLPRKGSGRTDAQTEHAGPAR